MAATLSPWAKPGAWALAAEEQDEADLERQQQRDDNDDKKRHVVSPPAADYPSLSAAAAAKPKKKNKGQTISLAEFTTYGAPKPPRAAETEGLTLVDRLSLPTGPRERTAEELDRTRGFRSYETRDRGNSRYPNGGGEESESKWGSGQRREGGFGNESNRDGPSRADEIDDWGAAKKSGAAAGNGFERRERGAGGGGSFFSGSQSKADESDSWVSNKSSVGGSEGRKLGGGAGGGFDRERKVGFGSSGGADSDTWGRKREDSNGGSGFDRERKVGLGLSGGGADAEVWGKRKEESNGSGSSGSEGGLRPRLNLQRRTLPVAVSNETSPTGSVVVSKPKGSSPFGEARPREEVLAEKGKDWKQIDEELEAAKIKEVAERAESPSFGKRSFGIGNGRAACDRTERAWRKPDVADTRPQSAEKNGSRSSSVEPAETTESRSSSVEPENGHADVLVDEN